MRREFLLRLAEGIKDDVMALALVGCHAQGMARAVCEVDLAGIQLTSQRTWTRRMTKEGLWLEIHALGLRELQESPSWKLALLKAIPLADDALLLGSLRLDLMRQKAELYLEAHRSFLIQALSSFSRGLEALEMGSEDGGAFWALMGGYQLLDAILLSLGESPHPSHSVSQLRRLGAHRFATCVELLGLEQASRSSVNRRWGALVGLAKERKEDWLRLEEDKVLYMLDASEVSEAYAYLGRLLCASILTLYEEYCRRLGINPLYSRLWFELQRSGEVSSRALRNSQLRPRVRVEEALERGLEEAKGLWGTLYKRSGYKIF